MEVMSLKEIVDKERVSMIGKTVKEGLLYLDSCLTDYPNVVELRLWSPYTIGTLDYREDRVNIHHNNEDIITKVEVG